MCLISLFQLSAFEIWISCWTRVWLYRCRIERKQHQVYMGIPSKSNYCRSISQKLESFLVVKSQLIEVEGEFFTICDL